MGIISIAGGFCFFIQYMLESMSFVQGFITVSCSCLSMSTLIEVIFLVHFLLFSVLIHWTFYLGLFLFLPPDDHGEVHKGKYTR